MHIFAHRGVLKKIQRRKASFAEKCAFYVSDRHFYLIQKTILWKTFKSVLHKCMLSSKFINFKDGINGSLTKASLQKKKSSFH